MQANFVKRNTEWNDIVVPEALTSTLWRWWNQDNFNKHRTASTPVFIKIVSLSLGCLSALPPKNLLKLIPFGPHSPTHPPFYLSLWIHKSIIPRIQLLKLTIWIGIWTCLSLRTALLIYALYAIGLQQLLVPSISKKIPLGILTSVFVYIATHVCF